MDIIISSNISSSILKSYCAYSSIGRICDRFPNEVNNLLNVFCDCGFDESKVISNLNKFCKPLVPYTLVLLKHLSKFDYYKLKYLFKENSYFDKYIDKLFLNKKLNKKDLIFKEYIEDLFLDINFNNKFISNVKEMISLKKNVFDLIYVSNKNININLIFLNTIRGISSGYGNYNFIIIESNIYNELLVIHELLHVLNYSSSEFKKLNTKINVFEFNEAFTNIISSIVYFGDSFNINNHKFYYSSKKGVDLENKIYFIYNVWKDSDKNVSFIIFLNEYF
jgi:hypothetical protein